MKRLMVLSFALLLAISLAGAAGNPQEHEMMLKVSATRADLPALVSAGLYIYNVGPDFVQGSIVPSKAPALDARGFRYEILIPDMVQYGEELMTHNAPLGSGLGIYHTYQQMLDTFSIIATNNPGICHLETLSRTSTGKYVLALEITQNPGQDNHRPKVLWDGTTHGNENIGTEAVWYFVQQLVGKYGTDSLITHLVNTRDIWMVPCFNPEGLINHQRTNSNGIDLNRENGYAWDNASGASVPFSQAETQGYWKFLQRHHITLDVTYHSGATVAMWVWGWTDQQPRDVSIMSDQVTRYANTAGLSYGMISQVMYFAPGGSTDFYYGCEGSLGYAAEISTGQYPDPPQSEIDTIAHANWTASRDLIVRGAWGMRGQITDSLTGQPVHNAFVFASPSGWVTYADTLGWYFRPAYAGSYSVKVMADGYVTKTISGVTVPTDSWVRADVALTPDTTAPITGYKLVWWICPDYTQVSSTEGISVLGRHDGTSLSFSNGGEAVVEMSRPIINGSGTDFTVYSSSSKACTVYVSADSFNGPWHFCKAGLGTQSCDLAASGVSIARYVRVKDGGSSYDLDAIEGTIVNAPSLSFNSLRIIDSTGNANGRLDPGEEAQLVVSLRNNGRIAAGSVTGNLHSWSSYVTVNDSQGTFGDIGPDSVRDNNTDRFDVTASAGTPRGTVCNFTLYLHGTSYNDSVRFSTTVGAITSVDPIPDGPRTPPLYYAYDDVDTAYPPHPTYSWVEVRGTGTHVTLSDDQTTVVSLPGAFGPWKFYGQRYTQVSISSNGFVCGGSTTSAPWTNAGLPGGSGGLASMVCLCWDDMNPPGGGSGVYYYHDAANHRFVVEYDSVSHYSPSGSYEKCELIIYDTTLAAPNGENVLVAQYWNAIDYSSCTVGCQDPTMAIGIQDLFNGSYNQAAAPIQAGRAIEYAAIPNSGLEQGITRVALRLALSVLPNPLSGEGLVRFSLPEPGPVSLKLYSADGRLVRTLLSNPALTPGTYSVPIAIHHSTFDISRGVYFLKLETGSGTVASKLVMLD